MTKYELGYAQVRHSNGALNDGDMRRLAEMTRDGWDIKAVVPTNGAMSNVHTVYLQRPL